MVACTIPALPEIPSAVPQLPSTWEEWQGTAEWMRSLELPSLEQLPNLPGLDALPVLQRREGALLLQGPMERALRPGERLPGTDIEVVSVSDDEAEFRIAGMRSVRTYADSVDYDGPWRGGNDVSYNLRARIYLVGDGVVRIAGVHQLQIADVRPVRQGVELREPVLRFPFATSVSAGSAIPGTTFEFSGSEERGARLRGLSEGDYPFRKIGDSITWRGLLRSDIAVEYSLRMLTYGEQSAQVGGTVSVSIPAQ
jgi:hypothetical protein